MSAFTAGLWGALAASSFLIGAALAIWLRPSNRIVGLVMGFGLGTLLSAIAYELVPAATKGDFPVVLGLTAGALTFFFTDWVIDSRGGEHRKSIATKPQAGAGLAIFLGTLLDGIPDIVRVFQIRQIGKMASTAASGPAPTGPVPTSPMV